MPRIVSLIASATEILCALGFERELVGRSHECDFPESIRSLPVCTEPKFPTEVSSGTIDRHVKALVGEGVSVYRVHADVLRDLQPDVIVTQTQCEVCAVSRRDVEQAVWDWVGTRPLLVSLEPNGLADVWASIQHVADALGEPARGEALLTQLRQRVDTVAEKASTRTERPRVACIEWIDPLMASGNWMPELVALAGGINLFGEADKHAPNLTWEQLHAANPDVILVLPCGFDLPRTRREILTLERHPLWPQLHAVQTGQVFLLDGNQYFNRPGPRLVESLEIIAEIFHPQTFHFRHEGTGWERRVAAPQSDWRERLEIVRGDITRQHVDAIVNAAKPSLLGGGGVDGAIHRAAGPQLLEACALLGGCDHGEARITGGYRLPARHVLHTPGPIWCGGTANEDAVLVSCYRNCFALVEQHGLRTVAFPSISTGAYGFPIPRACRIALREFRRFLESNVIVEKVIVVCFEAEVYDEYCSALGEVAL